MMSDQPIIKTITLSSGEMQTCLLKEKFNNENGDMVYHFHNETSGDDYTLVQKVDKWHALNSSKVSEEVFKSLCAFAGQLNA